MSLCLLQLYPVLYYFHVGKIIKNIDWTLDSQSQIKRKVKKSTLNIHTFDNFYFIQFYYDQILVMDSQYIYKSTYILIFTNY